MNEPSKTEENPTKRSDDEVREILKATVSQWLNDFESKVHSVQSGGGKQQSDEFENNDNHKSSAKEDSDEPRESMLPEHPTLKMTNSAQECDKENTPEPESPEKEEPEEPEVEKSPEEKENDRIMEYISSLNKQEFVSLYEKLALEEDLSDFEYKVRDKLD